MCSTLTPEGDAAACSRATFPNVSRQTRSPCSFPYRSSKPLRTAFESRWRARFGGKSYLRDRDSYIPIPIRTIPKPPASGIRTTFHDGGVVTPVGVSARSANTTIARMRNTTPRSLNRSDHAAFPDRFLRSLSRRSSAGLAGKPDDEQDRSDESESDGKGDRSEV